MAGEAEQSWMNVARAWLGELQTCVDAADYTRAGALYAEDVVFFGGGVLMGVGRATQEHEQWRWFWPQMRHQQYRLDDLRVFGGAQGLCVAALLDFEHLQPDGSTRPTTSHATYMLMPIDERWVCVHAHHSAPRSRNATPHPEHDSGASEEPVMSSPADIYEREMVPILFDPLATHIVATAQPQPGERVLDVACGTGIVARRIAPLVGPTGQVTGLDLSPAMLVVARTTAVQEGHSITWHQGAADALPFPDWSFDLVVCQHGLQFMPDKPAVVVEVRRVLRAGASWWV